MSRVIQSKQIKIGDRIEVIYQHHDLTKTVSGTVGRRDVYRDSIDYLTPEGCVILTVFKSGHTAPQNIIVIRLLAHRDMSETTLPGLEELMKEVSQ